MYYSSEPFKCAARSFSTRILWAAQRGADAELREVLRAVPRDAEVSWLDEQRDTALWVAVANDRVTTATLLLDAKACVDAHSRYIHNRYRCYQLWSRHNERHEGPLHLAAATCVGPNMVQLLVLRRADVNAYNQRNETVLHCAQGASTVRALVAAKTNPNGGCVGRAPLFDACMKGDVAVVRALLESKACATRTCGFTIGWNTLHAACSMYPMNGKRMAKIVAALLAAGARADETTGGFTPRDMLAYNLRFNVRIPFEFTAVRRLLRKAERALEPP